MIPTDIPLLDDFNSFLRYLDGKPSIALTGAGDLKAVDLYALNERVEIKTPFPVTPRSRQADYPLLNLLFQIATASRLYLVTFGKTNALIANAPRLEAYGELTREEQYVFLLETAWCYADWGALDNEGRSGLGAEWFRRGFAQLLKNPVGSNVTLYERWGGEHDDPQRINITSMSNAYLRAGHWFGWYDMQEIQQEKRDNYSLQLERVALTGWGQQCLTLLLSQRPFHHWNQNADGYVLMSDADDTDTGPVDVNTFADVFRTQFHEPALISLYPINPNPQTGEVWLRVELPNHKVSRLIALPVSDSLDDLHLMIQDAFEFDNDHLYGFYLNMRDPYRGKQYFDPRPEPGWADGYPADETTLASLNLYEGQRLLYRFDFGDRWEFVVTVVRHLPEQNETKARVVEKAGKPPEQYRENHW